MSNFVTGANGFLGSRLCQALATRGEDVIALCRRKPKDQRLAHDRIRIVLGDISDSGLLMEKMTGCIFCFHLAAIAKPWTPDPNEFEQVNVTGTNNVLTAAVRCGLKRVVFTSTAGVFGNSSQGKILDENSPRSTEGKTEYERSKIRAEQSVLEMAAAGKIETVIVNPTRIFGPGPLSIANSLTRIMLQMDRGEWRYLPGTGDYVGNYVFIDDVVDGHIGAMDKGVSGDSYVLGGEDLSLRELFEMMQEHANIKRRLISVPAFAIYAIAYMQLMRAKVFKIPPKITPTFARKYFADYRLSSEKAKSELGYQPGSVGQGIAKTMEWLHETKPSHPQT